MGTLAGHLLPGATFTLLGLWHLLNTSAAFRLSAGGAATFPSRTWFPSPFIKHLELLLLLLLSLLATAFLLLSPSSPADTEHAAMFLHLAIYSAASLAADILPSPSSASASVAGALASSAFAQELLLLRFHSIDHSGLEGHYHRLMLIAVATCLVSTAAAAAFPMSHLAAAVRSAAVTLQGLWFVCTGLVLWGPDWLLPVKCAAEGGETAAACAGEAEAMANVQFSFIVAGVAALTAGVCLLPDRKGVEYRKVGEVCGRFDDGCGGTKQSQALV